METKTLAEWRRILIPIETEALNDTYPLNPDKPLTANEVLDAIVE